MHTIKKKNYPLHIQSFTQWQHIILYLNTNLSVEGTVSMFLVDGWNNTDRMSLGKADT
jgi:hypothetical protein